MIRNTLCLTKTTPVARRGMVVAEHPIGAEVGAAILERGGNAVDAAVATAFAMTVVEPFMSSIAGGGSMLVHLRRRGETVSLDFNVEAPRACGEHSFSLDTGVATDLFPWRRVVDDANVFGPRAVAVPGSVAGLTLALERFGTMDLADVMAPAIRLAEEGFIPDWYVALTMAVYAEEIAAFPETARTYLRGGHYIYRPPAQADGDVIRQPELARSLRLIAREGSAAFYQGAIGQAIHDLMASTGGFLTRDDLAAYEARIQPPLYGTYRNVEAAVMPGATGGVTALEILNILAEFPPARVGYSTTTGLHLRAEAVRRAFLDRLNYLGDPRQVKAPWAALGSRQYASSVAGAIRASRAGREQPAPSAWAFEGNGGSGQPAVGNSRGARAYPAFAADGDCTTHVGVVDRHRNVVSLTHTAVSLFGARMVVPDTGILLSNGMLWFDPEPGRPNSIAPGKRALVNMVPLLGFRRGAPYLTLGAPGGRKIISVVPQVLANIVDQGDSLQAAMEAPRLHAEDGELLVDTRAGEACLAGLARLGHHVVPKRQSFGTFFFARPVAIRITRNGLEAGLDPWSDASGAGM
jgi:gamma-glutamyltranspeptidase/glutathione hydrolase